MEATSNALVPVSGRELAKRKLGDIVKVEDSSDSDSASASDSDEGDSYVASSTSTSYTPHKKAKTKTKVKTEPREPKTRKPKTNPNPGPKTPPKKWTAAELEALFAAALGDGPTMRMFENKVPGRTSKQCADAWSKTVHPYIIKALRERGEGKR